MIGLQFRKAIYIVCSVAYLAHAVDVQAGGLQGAVRDRQGFAMNGLSVNLYSMDGYLLFSSLSAPNGSYLLENVPDRQYNLKVLGANCAFEQPVMIAVGPPTSLDITLACNGPKAYIFKSEPYPVYEPIRFPETPTERVIIIERNAPPHHDPLPGHHHGKKHTHSTE